MTRDELVKVGMLAYKGRQDLDPHSPGLKWLRTPMEKAVNAIVEAQMQAWSEESHGVRFNHAHDDLTPHQRVLKWLKGGTT
jgi:hypothetical protein